MESVARVFRSKSFLLKWWGRTNKEDSLVFKLIQLDGTWKAVLILALLGAVYALLIPIKSSTSGFSNDSHPATFMYVLFIIMLTRTRAKTFHISLPIPAHQLFLAYTVSSLSPLWVPSIVAIVVAHFYRSAGHFMAMSLLVPCSVSTLCFFILHSADLKEQEAPRDMQIVSFCVLFMAFICLEVMVSLFSNVSVLLAVFLIPSAFLFIYIWNKIPPSFLISRSGTAGWLDSYAENSSSTKRSFLLLAWRPVLRSVFSGQFFRGIVILLMLMSIFVWHLSIFMIVAVWVAIMWIQMRERLAWIYAFPVSRSVLLPIILAPILILIIAGYSMGIFIKGWFAPPPPISAPVEISQINKTKWNEWPPREFWKPAPGAAVPRIEAPWGEICQPPAVHVLGRIFYNPYALGDQNSTRFFEWQLARGTQAIYGRAIPISEFQRPQKMHLRLIYPLRIQLIHIGLMIAFSLIVISCVEIPRWRRIGHSARIFGPLYLIGVLTGFALLLFQGFRNRANELGNSLPLRISWLLPDNLFAAAAVMAVSLAILYWITDKMYREAE
jgi:hypothetical protein